MVQNRFLVVRPRGIIKDLAFQADFPICFAVLHGTKSSWICMMSENDTRTLFFPTVHSLLFVWFCAVFIRPVVGPIVRHHRPGFLKQRRSASSPLVAHLFALFIPTVFPLTLPMACLLGCLMTFGRLSEENELTAVRAAGVSLWKALWIPPLFALTISLVMIPFNTRVAPWGQPRFSRHPMKKIANADPVDQHSAQEIFRVQKHQTLCRTTSIKNPRS